MQLKKEAYVQVSQEHLKIKIEALVVILSAVLSLS